MTGNRSNVPSILVTVCGKHSGALFSLGVKLISSSIRPFRKAKIRSLGLLKLIVHGDGVDGVSGVHDGY